MSDGRKTNGGARKGAGRKPKAVRFATQINRAEKRIADRLPRLVDNLFELADGGYLREKKVYKPAGLIYLDLPERNRDGTLRMDTNGHPIMVKQLAFPDFDPEQEICVERSTEIADRDRDANKYLMDRIIGKPTQQTEVSGPDGGPIETIGMSLDEWKQQAAERVAQAGATLAQFGEDDDA